jgi:nucleoside-diphosphate-sugar epimerase
VGLRQGALAGVVTRVLVTGAAGFLGAQIVRVASSRGGTVTSLTHRPAPGSVAVDLTVDELDPIFAVARPDVVINAASYGVGREERDMDRMFAVNTIAVHRLLSAAKTSGVRRFIQLGTYSEYGDQPQRITEGTPLRPKEGYGVTKAAASLLVLANTGLPESLVLRLFNIFGPEERPHRLLRRVAEHCRNGARLPLTPGDQVKDWAYVGDVAEWIVDLALLSQPYPHSVMNVSSGLRMSVRELALAGARRLKGEHLLDFGAVPVPAHEVQTGAADLARLEAVLPRRRTTPLDEALALTVGA